MEIKALPLQQQQSFLSNIDLIVPKVELFFFKNVT